jgi:guanylate kinase
VNRSGPTKAGRSSVRSRLAIRAQTWADYRTRVDARSHLLEFAKIWLPATTTAMQQAHPRARGRFRYSDWRVLQISGRCSPAGRPVNSPLARPLRPAIPQFAGTAYMPDASADSSFQIVVLSGPSGSGKTTIVSRLLDESPVPLQMSISATTRPMRPGEVDGVHYHFLPPDEFERRRQAGEFLEYAEVHKSGYWYGTLRTELDRIRHAGAWALLEVDVQGALNIMTQYPDCLSIFLETPSVDEYERRLRARGTEDEAVIQRRLQTARQELELAVRYRFRVVNDNLDSAVRNICGLLAARKAEVDAG